MQRNEAGEPYMVLVSEKFELQGVRVMDILSCTTYTQSLTHSAAFFRLNTGDNSHDMLLKN